MLHDNIETPVSAEEFTAKSAELEQAAALIVVPLASDMNDELSRRLERIGKAVLPVNEHSMVELYENIEKNMERKHEVIRKLMSHFEGYMNRSKGTPELTQLEADARLLYKRRLETMLNSLADGIAVDPSESEEQAGLFSRENPMIDIDSLDSNAILVQKDFIISLARKVDVKAFSVVQISENLLYLDSENDETEVEDDAKAYGFVIVGDNHASHATVRVPQSKLEDWKNLWSGNNVERMLSTLDEDKELFCEIGDLMVSLPVYDVAGKHVHAFDSSMKRVRPSLHYLPNFNLKEWTDRLPEKGKPEA